MRIICPYCGSDAKRVTGEIIYPERLDLHHLWFWYCKMCNAWVGTHKKNGWRPYGRLADLYTRQARRRAHKVFDKFWDTRKERAELYKSLAKVLNLTNKECHIGNFTSEMCVKVIKIFSNYSAWEKFCQRYNGDNVD